MKDVEVKGKGNIMNIRLWLVALVAAIWGATPAFSEQPLKIAFVDPLSGPAGATGEVALKQFQFAADRLNATGGILGRQIEIVSFDNKGDPGESRISAQKAIDQGIRFIAMGTSSSGATLAVSDFLTKFNARNPGKETVLVNFASVDTSLTNENCSYWHFRFDTNNDMKAESLTSLVKAQLEVKKVYIIGQDYSAGRAVFDRILSGLKTKRPDIEIVGSELHPLLKVTDFSPYVAKIKASGADSVITANWQQDLALLLKAAGEAGLNARWFTLYAYNPGSPTAVRQAGLADRVLLVNVGTANVAYPSAQETQKAFRARFGGLTLSFPQIVNTMMMLKLAAEKANSTDAKALAAGLEGLTVKGFFGAELVMRKADHQIQQDYNVASFGPPSNPAALDEEDTGWGWKPVQVVKASELELPTTCKMQRP